MWNLLATDTTVTSEAVLGVSYLLPVIVLITGFLLNYALGSAAVYSMAKRYNLKSPSLVFVPFVRYYFVAKLAYGGTMNLSKKEWLGIAFPIIRGLCIVLDLVSQIIACIFAYGTTAVDVMTYYNRYLSGQIDDWQTEFERDVMPAFLSVIDVFSVVISLVSIVFSALLFMDFFRRFKTQRATLFTILSLFFIDGIFLMAVKNNKSVEEMRDAYYGTINGTAFGGFGAGRGYGQAPYGNQNGNQNPYGNGSAPYGSTGQAPYGNNGQAPYGNQNGNQNPYGNGSAPYGSTGQTPYGNNGQAPYGNQNGNQNPYGNGVNNGTGWDAPSYPGSQSGGQAPNGSQPNYPGGQGNGQSSPFSEFDRPDTSSSPFVDLENGTTSHENGNVGTDSSPFAGNRTNNNSDDNDPFRP